MLGTLLRALAKRVLPAGGADRREAQALSARATELLREGDADGARLLAERALELHLDQLLAHHCLARLALPGIHYLEVLQWFHRTLRPATYVEIGVFRGDTLRLADPQTQVVGVDPEPRITAPLGPNTRVFAETSDAFFAARDLVAELGGRPVELAFIDGMHHFEFALRDFMNLERCSTPRSVILLHDCYPLDARTASRERSTEFWSGDIWRTIAALRKYRPDLEITTLDAPPTGLGMITRLDPASRVLDQAFDSIVAEVSNAPYEAMAADKARALALSASHPEALKQRLDRRPVPD